MRCKHALGTHNKRIRSSGILLLRFKVYKVESGEIFIRCGTFRMLQSLPRSVKDIARHAEDVAKHAEDSQGRCLHA